MTITNLGDHSNLIKIQEASVASLVFDESKVWHWSFLPLLRLFKLLEGEQPGAAQSAGESVRFPQSGKAVRTRPEGSVIDVRVSGRSRWQSVPEPFSDDMQGLTA